MPYQFAEVGLVRVMPYRIIEIGRPGDTLLNAATNLRYGCTILRCYYDKENGDRRRALSRYDGRLGQRKSPNKVIHALTTKWFKAWC
jgi:soluble lytic murein transglycosylase-like protein